MAFQQPSIRRGAFLLLLSSLLPIPCLEAQPIRGGGTPLAEGLYSELGKAYALKSGVKVQYEVLPTDEALQRLRDDRLDFVTLGLPLSLQALQARNLVQFPTAIGGLVVAANVPAVVPGALRLSGKVLADVFLGKITRWNDPALAAINAGVALPDTPIQVVHTIDASSATFLFTSYLSAESGEWREKIGTGSTVRWPVGTDVKDEDAVLTFVQTKTGAVSYADYSNAAEKGVPKPRLQNRAGAFVAPNVVTFQNAASSAPWETAPAFALTLVDPTGVGSWPMSVADFTVLPLEPREPERVLDVLRFFQWSFDAGAEVARNNGYVTVPQGLATLVEGAWSRQIKTRTGESIWKGR